MPEPLTVPTVEPAQRSVDSRRKVPAGLSGARWLGTLRPQREPLAMPSAVCLPTASVRPCFSQAIPKAPQQWLAVRLHADLRTSTRGNSVPMSLVGI